MTTYEDATTTHDSHVPVHAVKQVNLPGTSSSQHTLTVRAWGVAANGVWPVMELWVNRQKISSWSVTATAQDYSTPVTLSGRDVVEVLFTNDYVDDHVDRNLRVESLQVDDQAPLPARRGIYDLSVDGPDQATILAAAFDDRDVYPGQTPMNWNGALRFVLGAGAARYGYDANGNRRYTLSASQADVYTYDVENRLHTVERNDTVLERYQYDETGQRLLKSTSTLTTTYVSPAYEVSNGVATTYYSFNGQRVALRKGSVLTYLHADHLGSTLLATDSTGSVVDNNQPSYFAIVVEAIERRKSSLQITLRLQLRYISNVSLYLFLHYVHLNTFMLYGTTRLAVLGIRDPVAQIADIIR